MDPVQLAGRDAEYQVRVDLTARFRGTGWALRENVRVPDPTVRRRRELDFVITTPQEAIVVELKNWSGELEFTNDGSLIQKRRYEEGYVNHGQLFHDLRDRVEVLRLHHRSRSAAPISIRSFVVFYNDRLIVPPVISSRSDVLTYDQILEHMPPEQEQPTLLSRILQGIFRLFGYRPDEKKPPSPQSPSAEILAFRDTIAGLGSWDVVEVNGGRVIFGDILGLREAQPSDQSFFDRRIVERIELSVDRPGWLATIFRDPRRVAELCVMRRDGGRTTRSLPVGLRLEVQPAGQPVPTSYELRNLLNVEFGYREKPKFKYEIPDLVKGMRLVGSVTAVQRNGVFVDLGLHDANGTPRDAIALPGSFSTRYDAAAVACQLRVGQRVVVQIEQVIEAHARVRVTILEPFTT